MKTIWVLNGPNLNLLGAREPAFYGQETLQDIETCLLALASELTLDISFFQSNAEDALINKIHEAMQCRIAFIIMNAGALTHTSLALRDALLAVAIPFIEVHLSNPYKREVFRHASYLSDIAIGGIYGLGGAGYELALRYAYQHLVNKGSNN